MTSLNAEGRYARVKTTLSGRFYYAVNGRGTFYIDEKSFDARACDVLAVPRDTPYDFGSRMEPVLFSSPVLI
jgi:gentisate 1,2-dioxygenase